MSNAMKRFWSNTTSIHITRFTPFGTECTPRFQREPRPVNPQGGGRSALLRRYALAAAIDDFGDERVGREPRGRRHDRALLDFARRGDAVGPAAAVVLATPGVPNSVDRAVNLQTWIKPNPRVPGNRACHQNTGTDQHPIGMGTTFEYCVSHGACGAVQCTRVLLKNREKWSKNREKWSKNSRSCRL